MKVRHYILLVLVLFTGTLFAADIRFTASVSKTEVGTGEPFEITFSVNANIERFGAPAFNGFQVVSGPNQSSSMTSINGNTSMSMSLSYDLVGVKEGEYTIGPATIVAGGKTYHSNAVKIKVVKGRAVQQNTQSPSAGGNAPAVSSAPSADLSKSLFIKAVASKTNVYQGEQITVSYKLYTSVNLVDNALDKLPDFNGFWSQEIKNNSQRVDWTIENYKGVSYHVATLKQIILFPERSGNLVLDPLSMTFLVRRAVASNDIFDQMFGGGSYQDEKYKASSAPVTIHVKPLPENGKPADFQGAVGTFAIQTAVDKSSLKANEALNYTVKVTGAGNLKLLNAPKMNFPEGMEKYDPKVTDNILESEKGVTGSREYKFLLIPRKEGNYTIAPMKFSYFNPATQRYMSLSSEPYTIKVAKGDPGTNVTAFSGANEQEANLLKKDIAGIKTGAPDLYKDEEAFYGSVGYWLLILIGPLAFIGARLFRKQQAENNKDQVKLKWKNANKIAAKHLAIAGKQLQAGDKKAFYEAVYKGLYGYLSDKLNISAADLNQQNIAEQLQLRQVDAVLISRLTDTLNLCEMARYAPVTGISEQEVFDKARSIINDIETHA
ncbi:BatD family protein [Pedobacter sp.]|jgi:hypothetical protein|uniref:BatD family protein n=1 Tax=Pedobacter sp. TaxID=1411316 RepID=UPI002C55D4CD|nr:BatD family protein [Pedobacter sp.]HWW43205.1 BatD family protein [Pedobacter sp.]